MPDANYVEELYADETCTTKLNVGIRLPCGESIPPPYALSTRSLGTSTECQVEAVVVRPVGATLDPASLRINLWRSYSGSCSLYSGSAEGGASSGPPSTFDYVELGDEMPPSAFVSAEVEID